MRLLAVTFLLCAVTHGAQDKTKDLEVIGQIKQEAFDKSQVMDTLSFLSDAYGPRLTASPQFDEAAKWAMDRLKSYGVENVHEEEWGPFGRSWSIENYTIDMLTPRYSHLVAAPLAWSSPTDGPVTGELIFAPLPGREYNLTKLTARIEEFEKKWRGKLKGKIVLISELPHEEPSAKPLFERYTAAELAEFAKAPEPQVKKKIDWNTFEMPESEAERRNLFRSLPESAMDALFEKLDDQRNKVNAFLKDEGALAVLRTDARAYDGKLAAEQVGSPKSSVRSGPPTFVVIDEQYSRMTRLLEKNIPVTVRLDLKVKDSGKDEMAHNIVGEIPGSSKPDEVVMIGAHFDSWHTGTGATDNGAGSAAMIEAMRILKAAKLPLKRTVRIGLWSGEEQGLFGSKAYVAKHLADVKSMQTTPEYEKFDAYLNLDNGSGRIRGVYLQGNDAARPLFEKWLAPFADMGASSISPQNTGGTDHLSFDAVGLPGFQFIQDPLDYGTVTHHSDVDMYSHAIPADLMQASAIIATLVYDIANDDAKFPCKPMPESETR
jgi:carboxypeptidase Q